MATAIDELGTWQQVGEKTLSDNWSFFVEPLVNAQTFRFTYLIDWQEWDNRTKVQSFALLRFYYPTGASFTVSPVVRLYPKKEREIRSLLLPEEFVSSGIVTRKAGIKRVTRSRRYIYSTPDVLEWKLKLEYLTLT